MSELVRNDSASVISSLQMYGDSEDEDTNTSSRNNSIDTKDASFNLKENDDEDMEVEEKESVKISEVKLEDKPLQVKKENDFSHGQTDIDIKPENVSPLTNTENEFKPNPLSTFNVQINAAPPIVDEVDIKDEAKGTPIDEFISDDEDGIHPKKVVEEDIPVIPESVNKDSPIPNQTQKRFPTRLVSYGPDEDIDEDVSESESDDDDIADVSRESSPNLLDDPSALSRSFQNMSGDEIKIPPEPQGVCSRALQNKIETMYMRMTREGFALNKVIQNKKSFRNPSIYEKLIDYCNIDQKGTNFPPEIYDPHIWGKESFYDELDRVQRKDMEKREKEKKDKTKIEFVVGTKKSSSSAEAPDEKKRKTKWDTQPSSGAVKAPGVSGPGVVNLTATATGTKATVISAVGSLSKKSSK